MLSAHSTSLRKTQNDQYRNSPFDYLFVLSRGPNSLFLPFVLSQIVEKAISRWKTPLLPQFFGFWLEFVDDCRAEVDNWI